MEEKDPEGLSSSNERRRATPETGPYVLRSLLDDVPLSAEGDRDDIEIKCVEFLGMQASIEEAKVSDTPKQSTTDNEQTRTYTLEPLPPRFYTSYKYHQTQMILQANPHTY